MLFRSQVDLRVSAKSQAYVDVKNNHLEIHTHTPPGFLPTDQFVDQFEEAMPKHGYTHMASRKKINELKHTTINNPTITPNPLIRPKPFPKMVRKNARPVRPRKLFREVCKSGKEDCFWYWNVGESSDEESTDKTTNRPLKDGDARIALKKIIGDRRKRGRDVNMPSNVLRRRYRTPLCGSTSTTDSICIP